MTSIKLNSHRNIRIPSVRNNPDVSGSDVREEFTRHDRIAIPVSNEILKKRKTLKLIKVFILNLYKKWKTISYYYN
jgi:hypothetical protein